jgi:hypothetical protein
MKAPFDGCGGDACFCSPRSLRLPADGYTPAVSWLSFFRRPADSPPRPTTEAEVLRAGDEFERKEKLVDRFDFLPDDMKRAAKDTALNRFLEILFSHLRK